MEPTQKESIGQPVDRQDARLKVTGAAKYTAEWNLPNMAHAVLVQSAIAKGRIKSFDLAEAKAAAGVLAIITHENRPPLQNWRATEHVAPLDGDVIYHSGQNIAVVVAETYEQARYAAARVKVNYDVETPKIEMEARHEKTETPQTVGGREQAQTTRGVPDRAYESAPKKHAARYTTPHQTHHPLEPHATVAVWEGDKLTVYDATQGVGGPKNALAGAFGLPPENVRVVCYFTGGGFGSKGSIWHHTGIAAIAAKVVQRPVKLAMTRQQVVTTTGHRGATAQDIRLGTDVAGRLISTQHETLTDGSALTGFFESAGQATRHLYQSPNLHVTHRIVEVNIGAPIYMRAPGESVGTYAIECAMDEMAYAVGIDPVAFRILNHADTDQNENKPFSSKHLKECYTKGMEMIGWKNRSLKPRGLREGRYLIGYGMATATYPGNRQAAGARVRIFADGHAVGSSGGNDIGTGAYTVFRQVTADALRMPLERVTFELGDTDFPSAPVAGGSWLTASIAPAAMEAAEQALQILAALAVADTRSPLHGMPAEDVVFADGHAFAKSASSKRDAVADIVKRTGKPYVEACVRASTMAQARDAAGLLGANRVPCLPVKPDSETDHDQSKYSFFSHGAQFCRLRVDEELGVVRLLDWASVMDAGRILNPKTARNQIMGGVGFGIGAAFCEETPYDPNTGRPTARNLSDYHIAANADVPPIQVAFIDTPDPHISRLGGRGIGEIGITGVMAAIANGIFNATGKRIRELPITPDKVIETQSV